MEAKDPNLEPIALLNVQLMNEIGDAGHNVRRSADQNGVVLVVRNCVDADGGALGIFCSASASASVARKVLERIALAGIGILRCENILQLLGNGLRISIP